MIKKIYLRELTTDHRMFVIKDTIIPVMIATITLTTSAFFEII